MAYSLHRADCIDSHGHNKRMVTLTPRQKVVIALLIDGMRDKEIALTMGVKAVTVRKHINKIVRKFGGRTRIHAIAKFIIETKSPSDSIASSMVRALA